MSTFLIVKKCLRQAIKFGQTVLIQLIHFSTNIDFVSTQLNVKNSSISNNSVYHKYVVNMSK